tara:strand:+ start:1099 stop:2463 length:1365 start_codon:yes stop_codon:yes gene_type:complete
MAIDPEFAALLGGLGDAEAQIQWAEDLGLISSDAAAMVREVGGLGEVPEDSLYVAVAGGGARRTDDMPADTFNTDIDGRGHQIRLKGWNAEVGGGAPDLGGGAGGGAGGGGMGGGLGPVTPPTIGTGPQEEFFGDAPEEFGTDILPVLTAKEIKDAEDFIRAELQMAGFDLPAINTMIENWIIPRLTGTYVHTDEEGNETTLPPVTSPENLLPELFEQPEFKARFPGYHPRLEAGYNAISIEDYLAYETKFNELMQMHGLNKYIEESSNTKNMETYIGDLIAGNISFQQIQSRMSEGVEAVLNAPPEVSQQFSNYFGPEGENALLANFLDPNQTLFNLKDMAQAAVAGGYAIDIMGEDGFIGKQLALEIADLDYTAQQLQQAYTNVSRQNLLFAERLGEEDYTMAREGVKAALNMDQDVADRVERRRRQRMSDFAGGGGAMVSGTTTGFGSANA